LIDPAGAEQRIIESESRLQHGRCRRVAAVHSKARDERAPFVSRVDHVRVLVLRSCATRRAVSVARALSVRVLSIIVTAPRRCAAVRMRKYISVAPSILKMTFEQGVSFE